MMIPQDDHRHLGNTTGGENPIEDGLQFSENGPGLTIYGAFFLGLLLGLVVLLLLLACFLQFRLWREERHAKQFTIPQLQNDTSSEVSFEKQIFDPDRHKSDPPDFKFIQITLQKRPSGFVRQCLDAASQPAQCLLRDGDVFALGMTEEDECEDDEDDTVTTVSHGDSSCLRISVINYTPPPSQGVDTEPDSEIGIELER